MIWINFLHLYQPANSESSAIKEALDKSYLRLVRLLEEHDNLKMTANISGCLLERLFEMGKHDFIARVSSLIEKGKLEIVGSASYHALLPLIPEDEVIKQIKENEDILRRFFGDDFKLSGFFSPEMAYSSALAKIIQGLGYKWIILDGISAGEKEDGASAGPFIDKASGLKIIFRSSEFSRAYPPDLLSQILRGDSQAPSNIIISATDAELYGLRHEDPTAELELIVKNSQVNTMTISEFVDSFGEGQMKTINLRSSSWESEERDIKNGEAFNLWQGKNNSIHKQIWRLAYFALSLEDKYRDDAGYSWYIWHLRRGLASCTFWWASAHDFAADFGPYAWNPDIVERGIGDLIRSIRSITSPLSRKEKLKAEKYYLNIKKALWREHWKHHWPVSTNNSI